MRFILLHGQVSQIIVNVAFSLEVAFSIETANGQSLSFG